MMKGVEALVATRPGAAQAPAPQRIADHFPTPVDHDEGLPRWLVLIPVVSLMMAGLLIMVLSTFVPAPPPSPSPASFTADEEVQVDLPVIDEIEVGETMVRLGPAFTR